MKAEIIPFPAPAPAEHKRQPAPASGFLTMDQIMAAEPPPLGAPHRYVRCPKIPGFGVCITSKGVRTYYFEARVAGEKNKTRVTFKKVDACKLKDAQAWARDMGAAARRGEPIAKRKAETAANPPAALSFAKAYEQYKADRTSPNRKKPWRQRTVENNDRMFALLADWHGRELFSITKADVSARYTKIRDNNGPAVAKLTFSNFGSLWNFHAADVEPAPASPTAVLSQKDLWPEDVPVERQIEAKDFPAWWRSLDEIRMQGRPGSEPRINPAWGLYFRVLALLGTRKTETRLMEWEWYDEKARVLTIPATVTKGRRAHPIPIGPRLAAMLAAHCKTQLPGTKFLFAHPSGRRFAKGAVDSTVVRHVEQHKVAWSPHDLRRVYATVVHDIGVPYKVEKLLLNHSTKGDVTLRYIKAEVAQHQERIEAAIFARAKVP